MTVVKDDPQGLADTVRSLDSQDTSMSVEHLIVDGSSQATDVAASNSVDGFVHRIVLRQPAQGVYAAMNFGLPASAGDYVWFINAGDTLASPRTLTRVQQLTETQPSWIVGRVRITDRSGKSVDSSAWDFTRERERLFAGGHFPPHQATIVRRALLQDLGGFDENYRICADYHAALRLAQRDTPLMTNEVLACFSEGGLSTQRWRTAHREFHRARTEVFAPTGWARVSEQGRTWATFAREFIHRSVLRADR